MNARECEKLVQKLQACSNGELREILFRVCRSRRPSPEATYYPDRFFLGTASRELESEPGVPEQWSA